MDKALASILAWWDSAGVAVPEVKLVRTSPARRARQVSERPKPITQTPARAAPAAAAPTPAPATALLSAELAQTAKNLEQLRAVLGEFNAGDMSDHARQAVFARGNPEADIMVIGEYPDRDADIQRKPFVGPSGQLLDKIFAAIGLTEDALYMTSVVNWKPPGSRAPNPEEIAICKPFLMRHIELMDPKFIVLVGGIPLAALTDNTSIVKNRGQWSSLKSGGKDIPVLPLYHPSSLLMRPALKKDMWRDILSLRERLEN